MKWADSADRPRIDAVDTARTRKYALHLTAPALPPDAA